MDQVFADPQVQHLAQRPDVVLSFLGPHAFMSTRVYPDELRVPTWNYMTVEIKACVRLLEGEEAKDAMLKQLISREAHAAVRPLPASPVFFGITAFVILSLLLFLVLRLDRD